jgi:hypothetical protein
VVFVVVVVVVVVGVVGRCGDGDGEAVDGIHGVAVVLHGFTTHGPPAGVFAEGSDVGWLV